MSARAAHRSRRGPRVVVRGALTALVLSALVSGCAGGGGGSPSPTSSASPSRIAIASLTGKILFTRAGGTYGDETVFTANPDGTDQQRITGFGVTCCPRWSSDGSQVLMAASAPDDRITGAVFRPNGSLVRKVPLPSGGLNLGCAQAYSLATGRLACEGWDDNKPSLNGIYTLRASDGGDLLRLTTNPAQEHDIPADYSPDGSKIFFFRAVEGFPSIGDTRDGSLFAVSADGKDQRRVTPNDMPVEVVGNSGGRLSADGQWLVFTTSGDIWKIHPDGSDLTKVFEDSQRRLAITPTWSPDGSFILFGLDPAGSLAVTQSAPVNGLYLIRADGTGLTPVLLSNDWKREPDWVAAH
jgi:Tol biopolymer transport system component